MPSTKVILQTAAIATVTFLAWETLATLGVFDWRRIPETVGTTLRPKPSTTPSVPANGAAA